ncbi:MAG: type II secretion system F family protein [candidate division KSB1 bacterium]|nr:type II secretion system F family protein [candidate division KSB1 bacterium]MDZ7346901.1 type II secretion system F family protein [candidate division KSB1 bacterium]
MGAILLLVFLSSFVIYYLGLNFLATHFNPALSRMKAIENGNLVRSSQSTNDVDSRKWPRHFDTKELLEELGRVAKGSLKKESQLKADLIAAGYQGESAYLRLMGIKLASSAGGFLLILLLGMFSTRPLSWILLMASASALSLFMMPDILLRFKVDKRQREIAMGLPDALDLLVICVEAGLGLNAAIQRVGQDMGIRNKSLSQELLRAAQDLRIGQTREKALRGMSDRNRVEDLRILVGALIMADKLGTSIASTLRAQAEALRNRIHQRAEENAAKASVKMLLPLVMFILPALFIVLIGPAVIMILDTFAK